MLGVTVVQPGVDERLNYRHAMVRGGGAERNFRDGWDLQNRITTGLWNMAPRGRAKDRAVTIASRCLALSRGSSLNLLAGNE